MAAKLCLSETIEYWEPTIKRCHERAAEYPAADPRRAGWLSVAEDMADAVAALRRARSGAVALLDADGRP